MFLVALSTHLHLLFRSRLHRSRRCGAAARRFDVLSDGGRAADAERRAAALRGDARYERRDGGRLIETLW